MSECVKVSLNECVCVCVCVCNTNAQNICGDTISSARSDEVIGSLSEVLLIGIVLPQVIGESLGA